MHGPCRGRAGAVHGACKGRAGAVQDRPLPVRYVGFGAGEGLFVAEAGFAVVLILPGQLRLIRSAEAIVCDGRAGFDAVEDGRQGGAQRFAEDRPEGGGQQPQEVGRILLRGRRGRGRALRRTD